MKNLLKVTVLSLLFVMLCVTFGKMFEVSPLAVAAVSISVALMLPKREGYAYTVNLNEVVVAELLEVFSNIKDDFLDGVRDESSKVNNDAIKFNDIGADPDVLVDNAVYPISNVARTDSGIVVSLNHLETVNTKITNAEYQALPYDKNSSVMQGHIRSLKNSRVRLALFSLAPTEHAAAMPVLRTTGEQTDGGRLRLTPEDIIRYKTACDNNEDPETRRLVLCPDHVSDLLLVDNSFRDRYNTIEKGKIIKEISGFEIFENLRTPKYTEDAVKKAWGSAAASTDKSASIYFNLANAFKAIGSANMFYRDKTQDPEYRQTVIGFDMYYIVSPVAARGYGAIVDGVPTT